MKSFLRDYVFPIFCVDCKREGFIICEDCFSKIRVQPVLACPVCHLDNSDGGKCDTCKEKISITKHVALFPYVENDTLGKMIKHIKYDFVEEVGRYFFYIIENYVKDNQDFFLNYDFIVPIPLHKKRFAERGYNQAEILAHALGSSLGIPVLAGVRRSRYTRQQAKCSKEDRLLNVAGAFVIAPSEVAIFLNKNILLVDDVYTTGATMDSCASTLMDVGAARVDGWSLARG